MRKIVSVNFNVKSQGDDTVIEGWANKAIVDRGNDVIYKDAWDLNNYEKNAIVLYNHDRDKPIGKALAVKATDEGLYIQARLSKSKDPFVSYVRDMVREGILNSFSVGFDAKNEVKNSDGVNEIKRAELYEVSIVTLPMNQDSQFRLNSKQMKKMSYKEVKDAVLKEKGAWVASAVHQRIYDLQELGEFNREESLSKIAELAGATPEELTPVLTGELTPVPEGMLAAISEVLGIDLEYLKGLDQGDVKVVTTQPQETPETTGEQPKQEDVLPDPTEEKSLEKEENKAEGAAESESSTVENSETVCQTEQKLPEATEEKQALAPNTPPYGGTSDILGGDDNPYLAQSKQTNVLLGTLISIMQDVSKKLDRVVEVPEPIKQEVVESRDEQMLTEAKAILDKAKVKLKSLGVNL